MDMKQGKWIKSQCPGCRFPHVDGPVHDDSLQIGDGVGTVCEDCGAAEVVIAVYQSEDEALKD